MRNNNIRTLTLLALFAVINIIGGYIALGLRLPIYLDSIGTVFAGALFGPILGMVPGLISGIVSGFTGDVYAFYYIPVQLITGLLSGVTLHNRSLKNKLLYLPITALISIPGTIVSSTITAVVFGGITSSGSTVLVQLLSHMGFSMTASVCIVQAITDYADRLIAVAVVMLLMAALPADVKGRNVSQAKS